ncbi:hypothetical protein ACN47E_007355 [Coniothyrium glycines]
MSGILHFLWSQVLLRLPEPSGSYQGKTIIVTGSNIGLGKEAARHFTRLGASTVILAVRSLDKGNAAKRDIEATTGTSNVVQVWELDMASYGSVLAFADKVTKELPRLDIAVLNAGVAKYTYERLEDNEASITINVLATFLLALTLLPKLEASAQSFDTHPTLTIVASGIHFSAKFNERHAPPGAIFDRLSEELTPAQMQDDRYPTSKLLDVLCARALSARRPAAKTRVTINYVCPGLCKSQLSRDAGWGMTIFEALFARTTEQGSRALVHAASQGADTHGQFMADCRVSAPSPFVLSAEGKEVQERVWEELLARLDRVKPGLAQEFGDVVA